MRKLFTIGYEGVDLQDFLQTLKKKKVNVLLDVREIPISRRKGFSKSALKTALSDVGIEYCHEKQLGSPKSIRHRLREDWNYDRFFRDFDRHMQKHTDLLQQLSEDLTGNVALMCYEKDHQYCHRSVVVDMLADKLDLIPIHLEVESDDRSKSRKVSYQDIGKSFSSA